MVVLLGALAQAGPTHAQMESAVWQPVAEREHKSTGPIHISSTEIEALTCFRAEAVVGDVDIDGLFAVASDPVSATEWSSSKITDGAWLDRTERVLDYYQYLDVAIVSDRYWFCRATLERDDGRRAMRWDVLPEGAHEEFVSAKRAANAKSVEPDINVGGWYFDSVKDGVRVAYQVCSQSGTLPQWVQGRAILGALPHTVSDLVREARRRK